MAIKTHGITETIKTKILKQGDLNDKEVTFVTKHIEPRYNNQCDMCRLRVLVSLGVDFDTAYESIHV